MRRDKSRNLILIVQIALSLVLVIGASLMVRSFTKLLQVRLGFDTRNLLTLRTDLDKDHYPQPYHIKEYQTEFLHRAQALGGVSSVAITNALPLGGTSTRTLVRLNYSQRGEAEKVGKITDTAVRIVSTSYFATMGVSLLRGRFFSQQDTEQSSPLVIINQSLAKEFGQTTDLIGSQVQFVGRDFEQHSFMIAGIVGDIKHWDLIRKSEPEIYLLLDQVPKNAITSFDRTLFFVVRTRTAPAALIPKIKTVAADIDKYQSLYDVRTMEDQYDELIAQPRFLTMIFSFFGIIALTLAAIGVYGTISYTVTQRTREIGVCMALGAQKSDVLRMIFKQVFILTLAGTAIGSATALALSRYLVTLLYELSPTDAYTYAVTILLLIAVAALAGYLPAQKALKADPLLALRHE